MTNVRFVLNKMPRLAAISVCLLAAFALAPPAEANVITGTHGFSIVSRLTGPDITGGTGNGRVGIGGCDLGNMVNYEGKTYFLFGDTFASDASGGSGGPDWRNNTMAWTTDRNPSDGITFDGWLTRPDGTARQVIDPGNSPVTYIPTGAITVGSKIYAWYMHVTDWSNWTVDYAGLAWWRLGDSQFTTVPNYALPGSTDQGRIGGNFDMVAASYRSPLEHTTDGDIYIWGTNGGREGGVKLARVAPDKIEDLSAYQYFDGESSGVPQWGSDELAAETIIPASVGEMSVMYNQAVGAWTLMYMTGGTRPDFEIRQSPTPWGPWSDPIQVDDFSQAPGGQYAPYMNPLFVEDDGKTLYFTMSLWHPYDVYLAKVTLDIQPTSVPEPASAGAVLLVTAALSLRRSRKPVHIGG